MEIKGMEISEEVKALIDSIPNRPLLRIDEVADLFLVTRRTVYNWYESDRIKGINLNGTLRIYRQSVIDMIINGNGKKADNISIDEIETIRPRKHPRRGGWVKGW